MPICPACLNPIVFHDLSEEYDFNNTGCFSCEFCGYESSDILTENDEDDYNEEF